MPADGYYEWQFQPSSKPKVPCFLRSVDGQVRPWPGCTSTEPTVPLLAEQGPAGVGVIAKGRGRKPSLPEGTVAQVLRVTLHESPPGGATHWTTRSMGARVGIGKDSVAAIWADHHIKPWKVATFKISTDPDFEAKLVDVVGL